MKKRKALIIGGGIAGPALALFLKRADIDAVVYEAKPSPSRYAGLFLNVAPNGLDVLRTLGIDQPLTEKGFPFARMVMISGRGKRLGEVYNGSRGRHGIIIKRWLLQEAILEEAVRQGIRVEYGKKLEDIEFPAGGGVLARFADGTEAEGDFLAGCDGIHSRTRRIVFPEAPAPAYTGLLSCGGFAYNPSLSPTPGVQRMIFGKKAFFGYLVKPSGEIYWFSNLPHPEATTRGALGGLSNDARREMLLEWHAEDPEPVREIIRSTEGDIGMYPIYDVPFQPAWHRGPVVLIGDAAHATSPHAGQGASLALEDAIVLARCLRDLPDPAEALAAFERLRRPRAEKVVRYSRSIGNNKAVSNRILLWLRDATMPFFLKLFASPNAHDWLYSYRVDWEERVRA
ncbi:MAG: FAD-dependent monooxygenase [Bacillota bacterium]